MVAIRRVLLGAVLLCAVAEMVAAALPWVVYQLPLDQTTVAGYATPISDGIATAGLALLIAFVAAARLATGTATAPAGVGPRLSGGLVACLGSATVFITRMAATQVSGDDAGLTKIALDRAGRLVDHNPGFGMALALGVGVALTILGCLLLFADNPSRIEVGSAQSPAA